MSDILSQDEVTALLKGVKSGEIETEPPKKKPASGISTFDFTSQERIAPVSMPGLDAANEKFAQLFKKSLSGLLMRIVSTGIRNAELMKFGDFIRSVGSPSSINLFSMNPLKGQSLLAIEAPLVYAFVDLFFGGAGTVSASSEGRTFTSIEQKVIRKIVDIALNDLKAAWSGIAPIQPEFVNAEMNTGHVKIVTPGETVLKTEIRIEAGECTGRFFVCIPYSMLEPVKEMLVSTVRKERNEPDQRWIAVLRESIGGSPVEVVAEIGRAEITCSELMNLTVGSIITTGKRVDDEFIIRIGNVAKFRGVPGYSRGNQAIKITGIENT